MLSSTSSSKSVTPAISVLKDWFYVAICLLSLIFALEVFFRTQGHRPHVVDSSWLWSLNRSDVYTKYGEKRIAIVGASRAQLGIVPEAMEKEFSGYTAKLLAINGNTPGYDIVKDLCEDPDFDGIILWEARPRTIIGHLVGGNPRTDLKHLGYYKNEFHKPRQWNAELNSYFSALAESNFVVMSSGLTLMNQIKFNDYKPQYINMSYNRYIAGRYGLLTKEELAQRLLKRRPVSPFDEKLYEDFIRTELPKLGAQLRQKGGQLILVHLPGIEWMEEEPQIKNNWDKISEVPGIITIYFRDYPELRDFTCPDKSHLDAEDAAEFTRQLSKIIKQKLAENPGRR